MFRSPFHDHLQGSFFVPSAFTTFSCLLRHLSFWGFVAVCPLFVCVTGVPVCVLSGRAKHDQTTQTHELNFSRLAAADLRLRPRSHWDRQSYIYIYIYTIILLHLSEILLKRCLLLYIYFFSQKYV
jgi:hypothetical protein